MAKRATTIPSYRRQRKGRRGFFGWIGRILLALFLLSIFLVVAYRFVPPPITATMVGDLIAGRGVNKDWMSLKEMDRDMVRAAIGAEDSKFCQHSGFDCDAIDDAARRNASGGRIRGGSTISQQTAKNVFLWQGAVTPARASRPISPSSSSICGGSGGSWRSISTSPRPGSAPMAPTPVERYFGHDASAM
jgi:monofunctional biosynthetic peptidoglycan transglycosylase